MTLLVRYCDAFKQTPPENPGRRSLPLRRPRRAQDGTTIQELLEQAVELLFVKNGKAKIADLHTRKFVHMTQPPQAAKPFDPFVPFIANTPLRDQRETMERPFFSRKNKRLKPIEYTSPDGQVYVHVFPNQEFGIATIWDAKAMGMP